MTGSSHLGPVTPYVGTLAAAVDAFLAFGTPDRSVVDRKVWAERLLRPLPDEGVGVDDVLAELLVAVEHGSRVGSPGFSGFITTGPSTVGVLSALASAAAGGQRYTLHAFNALEQQALDWLADACGLGDVEGVLCSGGSVANLLALGAARQWTFEQRGHDVSEDGLPPGVVARVYGSTEAHRTLHRACGVLGLGRRGLREIPTDSRQRVDARALEAAVREDVRAGVVPLAVVGIAGTTNTGAVDPLDDLLGIAREAGAWFHVDGAYGLLAAADPAVALLMRAAGEADSAILDPHKWLATGVGVAAAYTRHPGLLTRAFAEGHAAYLEGAFGEDESGWASQFDSMGADWADRGVELSAPSRGVHAWAVLREIGRRGLAERVARDRGYAQHVTRRAHEHPRLEALVEPELSIACVRYVAPGRDLDGLNARLLARLRRETPYVPSSTVVDGSFAIRPCYVNPRTRQEDVDGLVDALVRLGDQECGLG
jgi:aromatic-L-amino-acid decarboxylase